MTTYLYFCEVCDKEFEENHSMSIVLEECPKCKELGLEPKKPKRLIVGGTGFLLRGGRWAKEGYS